MINFTTQRNEGTIQFSACSSSIAKSLESEEAICKVNSYFFVFCVSSVHVILSLTSLTGNILILIALQKVSSLHSSSKLLFRCLSCTDLFVGIFSQPIFVTYLVAFVNKNWNICEITESLSFISGSILCGESISTLTAISVDRLLSLVLRSRYREIVTFTRVRLFVITSSLFNIAFAMTYLWSKRLFFMGCCVILFLLLSISSCCYLKIYVSLRLRQVQVHGPQVNLGASLNMARYKKTVASALWIYLTILLCYVPYTVATTVSASHGVSPCNAIAWNISGILVFLNSSLNPILYCWKIRAVRQAVKQTITQCF